MTEEFLAANRAHWDELVPIHAKSDFYDLGRFKAGGTSLKSVELEQLGDVSGRSLLHLQCHFGMDTLSWARLGARVTGMDFSSKAIEQATNVAEEIGIDARFIESNIYDLPNVLDEEFDIVFTSYGVLVHLPDMPSWAKVVARFLKPGGAFHMVEFHPFSQMFDDTPDLSELKFAYPYFDHKAPLKFEPDDQGSYADRSATVDTPTYEWSHSLSIILGSLLKAGLRIETFREFNHSVYRQLPFMEQSDDGYWRMPAGQPDVPLMFSVLATKPA
jgi:ubiquinone/menaquinone biosynthesis C-methylase UbiE